MSRLSWGTKLIGLFTLVLGASLLFQVFYVLPTIRNQQVEMAQAQQLEITHNTAWQLDTDLMGMRNSLTKIAELAEFRNMDIGNQQQIVTQLAELSPDIYSLYVVDAEGWFVAGTAEDLSVFQKRSYTDKPYYIAAVEQGQVYSSEPRSYFEGTIVSTSVSVPIESDAGERVGLLMGTIWLNPLIEKLKNYPLDEETAVFVVDREGMVVAHSGMDLFALEEGPLSLDFSDKREVRAIMDGDIGGSEVHEHEGEPYSNAWTALESTGWGVVVEAPMRAILAESNALAGRLLSVNVVLFVIALAVSLVITQQVTAERMRAEQALQASEQWLSTTLRSIGDAVIATDAQGFVTLMNPVAGYVTGWGEVEAVGKSVEDVFNIINEQTGERAENPVARVLREGVVVGLANHTVLVAKDGTKRPIADSGAPMRDEAGNIIGTVMVFRDITELQEMQERLVRSERLAVLGQLAGGVGHELRNPLGAIKNAAHFLNMVLEDPEAETREMLEILDREVGTAEKIISSLLDYARTRPPTRRQVDLSDVVQEALSRSPLPDAPRVEVVLQLDEDLPFILSDPDQLSQVLGNIIRNGVQAMPEGGQLTIKTLEAESGEVVVSIADSGAGISEENLKRIFEPLFTTRAKGIGLGLAVVKALVEGHGGTIAVESHGVPGEGSTFTVRLPMGVSAAVEEEEA